MKIEKIKIKNWKSIKGLEIDWQDLLIFIGANNAGKSNILSSLLFFFDEIKPDQGDICKTSGEDVSSVEIVFKNLTQDDLDEYSDIINNNKIIIKKTFNGTDNDIFFEKYFKTIDIAVYPWLDYKYEDYKDRTTLGWLPIQDTVTQLYPTWTITREKYKEIIDRYKSENPWILQEKYELIWKTNPLNINVLYVPALKDVNDEFSRWTISKLLKECFDNVFQHTTVSTITWSIRTEIDKLNEWSVNRPEPLAELEREISDWMTDWNAQFKVKFDTNIEDILKTSYKVLINDWVESDITKKGHGFQRNLIFSLLKIRQSHHGQNQENSILLFEEPELYLHPQAQRRIYEEIKQLSNNLLFTWLTTHSNLFIKLEDYKNVCIVKKELSETKKIQVNQDIFWTDREKFQLQERIDATRSELFFAKKVIIVEGMTDKVSVPFIAKKLNCHKPEYSIIMCDGKDTIPKYVKLLNNFQINYIAVFDKDNQWRKNPAQLAEANADSMSIVNLIDATLWKSVIFENDIEGEVNYQWYVSKKTKPHRCEVFEYISNVTFNIPNWLEIKIREIYS